MNFYFSAKVWNEQNDAPNTSKSAKPSAPLSVRNARVIVVKDAMYRGATISGTFLLGDKNELPLPRKGLHIVEVYCCWFGLRLKTRGLHFKVNMSNAEVIDSFSGNIFTVIEM
jgi:hypothetical protein